jgi:truncated hemoglobin YjbI
MFAMNVPELHDIRDRDDIAELVTEFYTRAFQDMVLGHIFIDVAKMDLEAHLPIMCDFWETVLFQVGKYGRNAFGVHLDLHQKESLTPMHFQRWLDIWVTTVDDMFQGGRANLAKMQANRVANGISGRLERIEGGEPVAIQPSTVDYRRRYGQSSVPSKAD